MLLSIASAILDSRVVTDQCSLTLLSRMDSVVECLRKNIVSEEKDVMQVRNENVLQVYGGFRFIRLHL